MPPSEPESEDAKNLFTAASQFKQAGELETALGFYTRALEKARGVELRSALLFHRSLTRSALKSWSEAMVDANECLSLRPSWSRSYECLASVLEGLDRTEEARLARELAASLAALKQDPSNETLRQQVRSIRLALVHANETRNPLDNQGTSPPQQPDDAKPAEAPSPKSLPAADTSPDTHASPSLPAYLSLSPRENRFDIPRDIQSPHDIVDPSKFREGQRVQVHGLSAAWKYNGMCGNVMGQEGERLIVALEDGGELHVKAKNLGLGMVSRQTSPMPNAATGTAAAKLNALESLNTTPLRDVGSTGPFRGHPTMPGNLNSTNPVSSAWETANNGPTGRGGIHAVIIEDREGNTVIENMGFEGQLWRQGVRRNDILVAVNDHLVKDLSLRQVHDLIEGSEGTRVYLTLQRGEESKEGQFLPHTDGQNLSKTWNVSIIRTHSYVIDCLVATHEELIVTMQNRAEDCVRMDYTSPLVTDLHNRVVDSMMVLKQDQQILLRERAELQCKLDEYDRNWNINAVDGRVTDDENRRLLRELEEREKMMEMMAADFDEEMGNARSRFSAVSVKLDQPFESIQEMHGDQTFEEKFASDIARVLNTDEDRVAVIGLTRGSLIVDTVFLPPNSTGDQRPARQLSAALKAKADRGDDMLHHSSSATARTVDIQNLSEATVLNKLRNSIARLADDNAELRSGPVSENRELKDKVHALERAGAVAERTIDELRSELAVIRNSLSRDQSIADRDALIKDLQNKHSRLEVHIKDLELQHKQQVATLQAVSKAESDRCAEADARARDLKSRLAEAERQTTSLEGQLAAASGIRESNERKVLKLNEKMEIMRMTEQELRKELATLQECQSKMKLESLSGQKKFKAEDEQNLVKALADLRKLESELAIMVPLSKHNEMKAACSKELADMARKLADYEKRVADFNNTLAKHAWELAEGKISNAVKHDLESQAMREKLRADALQEQLDYRNAEVAGLRQQLREMLGKSQATQGDVAVVLQENLKTISLQTKELETLRGEKVEHRASVEAHREQIREFVIDIRRLLRVELEKGDGGILHRLYHSPSIGTAPPLEPLLHDFKGRDPVDAVWIRGLEARVLQMRERIASLEKGVIGDWLSSTKQNATGKQRQSPRKSSQADLSPEADGDLHKSRGSSVGQGMISEHSQLQQYLNNYALTSTTSGGPPGAHNQATNQEGLLLTAPPVSNRVWPAAART